MLERVDAGRIAPEHAHLSLVFMTTLMQAVTGSLLHALLLPSAQLDAVGSAFCSQSRSCRAEHLCLCTSAGPPTRGARSRCGGVPGSAAKCCSLACSSSALRIGHAVLRRLTVASAMFDRPPAAATRCCLAGSPLHLGIAGIVASAFIYLVPARPSWNMAHTPIDFLLSAALIGALSAAAVLASRAIILADRCSSDHSSAFAAVLSALLAGAFAALLWLANQAITPYRLSRIQPLRSAQPHSLLNSPGASRRASSLLHPCRR